MQNKTLIFSASLTAVMMCGCQEEEFDFTYEEVHRSVVEREYIKAFNAEFPEIDPNHDWMCEPDTIYEEVQYNGITRAHSGAEPVVYSENVYLEMSYTMVKQALDYMKEAEDNRGKCAQDFEYKAIEDNEGGYELYTITPTFWGRKFCDTNWVGIYYIGSDGNKYDLILMDLNLADAPSGDELIQQIRSLGVYTDVVFYSAGGIETIKQKQILSWWSK